MNNAPIHKYALGSFLCAVVMMSGCSITPQKLDSAHIKATIKQDQQKLYQGQTPIQEALGLGDVLARAIRYNLQHRTELLTQAISLGQLELARYDMLPTLAAEAGFISRSNVSASRSVSIFTNNETLEPSTSQDKDREIAKLKFSWNILDFGVSYFAAKQNANKAIIADHARQKTLHNILQQTYAAYWNALAAQELLPEVKLTLDSAKKAISNIDQGLKAKAYRSPIDALKLKKQLHESAKELDLILEVLHRSETVLRNLINVSSKQKFVLKPFAIDEKFALASASREQLELTALTNSTDIHDSLYNARIEQLETKKAIARMFPGIEVSYNSNYDSNSFAYNDHWGELGLQVSFNLMKLASSRQTLKSAKMREALEEQKRLALSMAVVTKFNLAMNQLDAATRQMEQAKILKDIDDKIASIAGQQAKTSKSLVENVQSQVAALQTYMGFKSMQTSVREAKGAVFFTLGLSPVPEEYQRMTLPRLSKEIETLVQQWHAGQFLSDHISESVAQEKL